MSFELLTAIYRLFKKYQSNVIETNILQILEVVLISSTFRLFVIHFEYKKNENIIIIYQKLYLLVS